MRGGLLHRALRLAGRQTRKLATSNFDDLSMHVVSERVRNVLRAARDDDELCAPSQLAVSDLIANDFALTLLADGS